MQFILVHDYFKAIPCKYFNIKEYSREVNIAITQNNNLGMTYEKSINLLYVRFCNSAFR